MLTTHNVPYALQHINDVFPDPESRPNMDSCPSRFSVCISHLLNDPYLFHKEAGTRTSQTGAHSGHAESWHGLPPQMMSTGGRYAPFSFMMSPICSMRGKRIFDTSMGNGSISLAQIGSIPHRTEARGKPEMPSNRLPIVSFLIDCVISYTPFYLIAAAMVLVTFTADCAV